MIFSQNRKTYLVRQLASFGKPVRDYFFQHLIGDFNLFKGNNPKNQTENYSMNKFKPLCPDL